jgi:hypothetical protein
LQKDPPAGIAAVPSDDNILIWHAFILGLVERLHLQDEFYTFFQTE